MKQRHADRHPRSWGRKLLWGLGISTLLVGLVGVLHVPLARSLGAGCPFEADAPRTAAERDANRQRATVVLRGDTPAPARPALHFSLGHSTRLDVQTWAESLGGQCKPGLDKIGLACERVETQAATGTLHADFDERERLVALSFVSREAAADDARSAVVARQSSLESDIGEPSRVAGRATAAYLSGGRLRQSRVEYRHSDYFASISATNLGPRDYLVSQVYRAVDSAPAL